MYTAIATIKRTVLEKYVVELDAPEPDDVLDLVYDHFSEFPNSDFDLHTRRRVEEETLKVTVIDVEHNISNDNDDGKEVA